VVGLLGIAQQKGLWVVRQPLDWLVIGLILQTKFQFPSLIPWFWELPENLRNRGLPLGFPFIYGDLLGQNLISPLGKG